MIVEASAPLRFSLGGGGTDLPAYASRFGGFVCSAAIDRRVTVRLDTDADPDPDEGPIVRAAKERFGIEHATITSLAGATDHTRGAGLGSSGSFTVAVVAALQALRGDVRTPMEIAMLAHDLERDALGTPIGLQDPTIAAFGGLVAMTIGPSGSLDVDETVASREAVAALEDHLIAFFSGHTRSAADVLADQSARVRNAGSNEELAMHRIKALGEETATLLARGDVEPIGRIFDEHWRCKRRASPKISSDVFDRTYDLARAAGAESGKLMGAGGGGHWLFFVAPAKREGLATEMRAHGLEPFPFRFSSVGVRVARL